MTQDPRRPVVVGVDASEAALRATRFAADEARRRRAPLTIVHAVTWLFDTLAIRPTDQKTSARLRAAADSLTRRAADSVEGTDLQIVRSVRKGDPVAVLREASAGAQLVVLGSRGARGVAGLLGGSTAHGLVAHARCPVVVLPDETAEPVADRRSVVVGVQAGGPGDADVLEFAFAEAAARGTDLVAVHAWEDAVLETAFRSAGPLADWAGMAADEQLALSEALAGRREEAPDVVVREVVVRDRPARAVLEAATTAALVVIGHRRRPALGSTTRAVLQRATCPVAVVPVTAARR